MALVASAWLTTEQELKFRTVATGLFGFGFALCFAAAAHVDTTVETAIATPRVPVAAIAMAKMIRRIDALLCFCPSQSTEGRNREPRVGRPGGPRRSCAIRSLVTAPDPRFGDPEPMRVSSAMTPWSA